MAIRFSGEDAMVAEIGEQLADNFDFANRLLRYWLEADKDTGLNRSRLPMPVLRVSLAMSVKACRQFRSVIELCERGEGVDGSIIARSMFETALVVGFVLKPRFVPREFDKRGKVRRTINVPGVRLTRELRSMLFMANDVLTPERTASLHVDRPGMKRYAKGLAKLAAASAASQIYRDAIGPEWTKILMSQPYTYSGLSISNLARSLGRPFPQWYDQVYGAQSEHVHAADMLHHVQMDDEYTSMPQWHESVEHVRCTLLTAIAMFYTTIGMLNTQIEFGVLMNTALHEFSNEYKKLVKNA